ncbi:MAG: LytTR family DNA-binding domain-containing protein, partial [Cytophagales bacterium]|nr:LytTR family DNA-binding domain-containing protein [Cytophagales bacterium]
MTSKDTVTAVIADDEPLLRYHLDKMLAEEWPELDVVGKAENGQQALELIEQEQPDIAFLDIRMPGLDGMSVARKISTGKRVPLVIFITAYDEYAVEAFETNAIDYLLKPVSETRLQQCVKKIKARIDQPQEPDQHMAGLLEKLERLSRQTENHYLSWIRVRKGDEIHLLASSDVLYIKAEDKYLSLYTRQNGELQEFLLRCSLKELLSRLDPDMFWQIHRSTAINISAVDLVRKEMAGRMYVMIAGTRLPVSRAMQ